MRTPIKPRRLSVEALESRQMLATIYSATLDADPGWATSGEWAFGIPAGQGGVTRGWPDPQSGYTGDMVYGVNLHGDYSYAASGGGAHYLTTGAIDCTGYSGVQLRFYQKLNTDHSDKVPATIEVSNNGSNWTRIYTNSAELPVMDPYWAPVTYDISAYADNRSAVRIRWGYQVIDSSAYAYSGWNIDDVTLTGTSPTLTWDGGSKENSLWTTAANWVGDIAPTAGSRLVFPDQDQRKESTNDFPTNIKFGSIEVADDGYIFHGRLSTNELKVSSAVLGCDSVVADTLTIGLRTAAANRPSVAAIGTAVASNDATVIAVAGCADLSAVDRVAGSTAFAASATGITGEGAERVIIKPQVGAIRLSVAASKDIDVPEFAGKTVLTPVADSVFVQPVNIGRAAALVSAGAPNTVVLRTVHSELWADNSMAQPLTDTWRTSTRAERLAEPLPEYNVASPIASLAAVERAFEDYGSLESPDRTYWKALGEGRAGRTGKPLDAGDAVLAAVSAS